MNCKPGDLARIVPPYLDRAVVGLPVTVLRAGSAGETTKSREGSVSCNRGPGGVGWLCDAHHSGFPCFIGDAFLRPIRDPGEDAQDEMLRPLPKAEPADTRTGQEVAA